MVKRMLFDASHPEETRVVILDGNRLEEFDYESAAHKTLKGNIYLAKVTRVEPSLQAAFVDYGGNRHGFLPFSEIHPDYYRIPIADREALIAEEAEEADDTDEPEPETEPPANGKGRGRRGRAARNRSNGASKSEAATGEPPADDGGIVELDDSEQVVEEVGGDEREDETRRRSALLRRQYKIQEVIKRRQIMLVQVVKEERGTKGAAMTTYISLAGRYCVLMPNTARGGGISRKITNIKDRKRLKKVIEDLKVPDGMAVILRTAGVERTKAEIKRDHEFLVRTWDEIRERTLASRAPALIYEEASLIKRAMRDQYTSDIEEILVDGEEAYRGAKDFMKSLMPSHARKVKFYKEKSPPLFHAHKVETQLDALHSPVVRLKSGGYLVINTTEALVAIDVNSGRSTRERHIEETALKTNLEAATEIARQLRLRDLAGLIVIDFIDMDDRRNNAAVERRLKEAMRLDRARVQVGRISQLGLLELSRQRLRPSLFELNMEPCANCGAHGFVRSVESSALHILREIEDEGAKGRSAEVVVQATPETLFYVFNQKRDMLERFERDYGMRVLFSADSGLLRGEFKLETTKRLTDRVVPPPQPVAEEEDEDLVAGKDEEFEASMPAAVVEREQHAAVEETDEREDGADGQRRRRRGRRGGRRRRRHEDDEALQVEASEQQPDVEATTAADDEVERHADDEAETPQAVAASESVDDQAAADDGVRPEDQEAATQTDDEEHEEKRAPRRRRGGGTRRRGSRGKAVAADQVASGKPAAEVADEPATGDTSSAEPALSEMPDADVEGPAVPASAAATTGPKASRKMADGDVGSRNAPQEAIGGEDEPVLAEIPDEDGVPSEQDTIEVAATTSHETGNGASENDEGEDAPASELREADEEAATQPPPREDQRPRRRGWWQRLIE